MQTCAALRCNNVRQPGLRSGLCGKHQRRLSRGIPPHVLFVSEMTLDERIAHHSEKPDKFGCILWTGPLVGGRKPKGAKVHPGKYPHLMKNSGTFENGQSSLLVHRYLYERDIGPIGEGDHIHHGHDPYCHLGVLCMNPRHYAKLTAEEHFAKHVEQKQLLIKQAHRIQELEHIGRIHKSSLQIGKRITL